MSEIPQINNATQPVFNIEKVYVKDLSLEIPNAPAVFLEREAPSVDIQLHHNTTSVDSGVYQTVLTATVTAKAGDRTMFLVEVAQAGIFTIRNVPQTEIEAVLAIACPNILFPFVREVVSDVVSRAGFPPVILSPVNFEAAYAQQRGPSSSAPEPVQIITPGVSH